MPDVGKRLLRPGKRPEKRSLDLGNQEAETGSPALDAQPHTQRGDLLAG